MKSFFAIVTWYRILMHKQNQLQLLDGAVVMANFEKQSNRETEHLSLVPLPHRVSTSSIQSLETKENSIPKSLRAQYMHSGSEEYLMESCGG